jgi:hypothetical protein
VQPQHPGVSALYQIGLPALLDEAKKLGINSLTRPDYGLSLTLGGGEVTLLEMTGAYGALANGGRRVTPRTVLYITDQAGKMLAPQTAPDMPQVMIRATLYHHRSSWPMTPPRIPSLAKIARSTLRSRRRPRQAPPTIIAIAGRWATRPIYWPAYGWATAIIARWINGGAHGGGPHLA